jgi:hypothetical protein
MRKRLKYEYYNRQNILDFLESILNGDSTARKANESHSEPVSDNQYTNVRRLVHSSVLSSEL